MVIPINKLTDINWPKVLNPMIEGAMGADRDKVHVTEIIYRGSNISVMVVNLDGEAGRSIRPKIHEARSL